MPPDDSSLPVVHLYTDGACSGNPGPGGWAFVLQHPASGREMERSGGEPATTNNRMELLSVIKGLEALKRRSRVELYTDSEYVRQGLMQWMPKWKANGWRRKNSQYSKGGTVKNLELWQQLDKLVAQHDVKFHRVAGHSGHPENERCDALAVEAYQKYLRK